MRQELAEKDGEYTAKIAELKGKTREDQEPESAESELVRQLRQELAEKDGEYTGQIAELKGKTTREDQDLNQQRVSQSDS